MIVVMLHHAYLPFTRGGGIGVDVFFVLSGFLITCLLLEEWQSSSTINLKGFYVRRILRLGPALVVLLLFVEGYSLLRLRGAYFWQIQKAALAALCYFGNWMRVVKLNSMGPLSHTWSLSVEEQFYLFWPPLLLFALRRLEKTRLLGLLTALVIMLICYRNVLWSGDLSWGRIYNGTDTRIDELLVGGLGALILVGGFLPSILRRWIGNVGYLPSLVVLPWFVVRPPRLEFLCRAGFPIVEFSIVSLIVFLMISPGTVIHRLLEHRAAVATGRISYGLYLWHFPIFGTMGGLRLPFFAKIVAMFATAVFAALASYFLVERRFLGMKSRLVRHPAIVPQLRWTA